MFRTIGNTGQQTNHYWFRKLSVPEIHSHSVSAKLLRDTRVISNAIRFTRAIVLFQYSVHMIHRMVASSNCHLRLIVIHAMWSCAIACTTMHTHEPLHGYYCPNGQLANIPGIGQQQCTGHCLINQACRVMSYNKKERNCILGEVPCAVAANHSDYVLTVFRQNLTIDPTIRKPKSDPLPARTVDTHVTLHEAVCIMEIGEDIFIGHGEPHWLCFIAKDGAPASYINGSLFLTVDPCCTLAWVPYVPGSTLLRNAVRCGYFTTEGHTYCARIWRPDKARMLFGYYLSSTELAYYAFYGFQETPYFDILIQVWTTFHVRVMVW